MNPTGAMLALDDPSHAPGVILRLHAAGTPATQAHTGAANLELGAPIEDASVFNTGSVAKQVIAYLCVRASREGLVSLDRPVQDLLPRLQIDDVTLGDLIGHRGGIRDAESLLSLVGLRDLDHYTADDLLELAYRQRHRATDPDHFLYSNTGYLLLAKALEKMHGTDLHDLATRQVFTPLGMTGARFKTDVREVIPNAAASYQPTPSGWLHHERPVTLPGPGSLWCTTADLDQWLTHLWREWQPASGRTLPFQDSVSYRPSDHPPFSYGPGLYADTCSDQAAVFHYGHEQGFSAAVHLFDSGLRLICLSNHSGIAADRLAATALREFARTPDTDAHELLNDALLAYRSPQPKTEPPTEASYAPHTPVGTYACAEVPGTVRLTRKAGALYLWRRGTCDRLIPASKPSVLTANGYAVTLPDDARDGPDSFVLDLDRAPGLRYQRLP
ncbi:beta-lactamase family protein [Nocardiopsis exhalans]|uniref:Beta-lactamase family protein n=1 Tax=Nocardiopsis exhalans TaxID=163604 RepID=A0ABY5D4K4_9ACTN|nr:serine hydrolase domain-containing protein [Nocardiopsis exhalans]USY18028.1 beta-lactamase family protein [Nocardiopsis exhalans]